MFRNLAATFFAVSLLPSFASAQGPEPVDPAADVAPAEEPSAEPDAATPDAQSVLDVLQRGGEVPSDWSGLGSSGAGELAPTDEGYAEDGEEYPVEFCGGGGEASEVDLAYYEMEEGRLARARRMLVTALREGAVDEWQRGHALATLAEVQLRLRAYAQAVVNYRKALRVDPDGVTETARVGLATALYLRGSQRAAHDEALAAEEAVCGDQWSIVACFGATSIVSRTSTDDAERQQATDALTQIRESHPDQASSFDEVEHRLEHARRRSRR